MHSSFITRKGCVDGSRRSPGFASKDVADPFAMRRTTRPSQVSPVTGCDCPRLQLRGSAGFAPASHRSGIFSQPHDHARTKFEKEQNSSPANLRGAAVRKVKRTTEFCKDVLQRQCKIIIQRCHPERSEGPLPLHCTLDRAHSSDAESETPTDPTRATFSSANRVTRSRAACNSCWNSAISRRRHPAGTWHLRAEAHQHFRERFRESSRRPRCSAPRHRSRAT